MLNVISLMGRLTRDPELRRTATGVAVTSFTVACDRDYTADAGGRETDFIDCVAWRQTAEFVKNYFSTGKMIGVAGRLQIRNWTDKDGNKRRVAEVVVEHAYFAGGNDSTRRASQAQTQGQPAQDFPVLDPGPDDQLPF